MWLQVIIEILKLFPVISIPWDEKWKLLNICYRRVISFCGKKWFHLLTIVAYYRVLLCISFNVLFIPNKVPNNELGEGRTLGVTIVFYKKKHWIISQLFIQKWIFCLYEVKINSQISFSVNGGGDGTKLLELVLLMKHVLSYVSLPKSDSSKMVEIQFKWMQFTALARDHAVVRCLGLVISWSSQGQFIDYHRKKFAPIAFKTFSLKIISKTTLIFV